MHLLGMCLYRWNPRDLVNLLHGFGRVSEPVLLTSNIKFIILQLGFGQCLSSGLIIFSVGLLKQIFYFLEEGK